MNQSQKIILHVFRVLGKHLEPHCFYTVSASTGHCLAHLEHPKTLYQEGEVRINQRLELICALLEQHPTNVQLSLYAMKGYHKNTIASTKIQLLQNSSNAFMKVPFGPSSEDQIFIQMNVHLSRCNSLDNTLKRSRASSESKLCRTPSYKGQHQQSSGGRLEKQKEASKATTSEICPSSDSQFCKLILDNLQNLDRMEDETQNLRPSSLRHSSKLLSGRDIISKVDRLQIRLNKLQQSEKLLQNDEAVELLVRQDVSIPKQKASVTTEKVQGQQQRVKYCGMNSRVFSWNLNCQKPMKSRLALKKTVMNVSSRQFEMTQIQPNFMPFTVDSTALRTFFSRQTLTLKDIDPGEQKQDRTPFSGLSEQEQRGQQVLYDKLSNLFDQATASRKKMKMLMAANSVLSENERVLSKKVELSQNIIRQNEQLLSEQLQTLKQSYKDVSDKLLQKYKQELVRENKIKSIQHQNEEYVREINNLKKDQRVRIKQMHNLKTQLSQQLQQAQTQTQPQASPILPHTNSLFLQEEKYFKPQQNRVAGHIDKPKNSCPDVTVLQLDKLDTLHLITGPPSIEVATDRPRWKQSNRLFRSQMPSRQKNDDSSEKKSYRKFERKKSTQNMSRDLHANLVIDLN